MCVVSFLENFYVDIRDRFIESVGESKLSELKLILIDRSYIQMYQCLSRMLVANNGGRYIKSLIENFSLTHKTNLERNEGLD